MFKFQHRKLKDRELDKEIRNNLWIEKYFPGFKKGDRISHKSKEYYLNRIFIILNFYVTAFSYYIVCKSVNKLDELDEKEYHFYKENCQLIE